jgi:hypothetical protein
MPAAGVLGLGAASGRSDLQLETGSLDLHLYAWGSPVGVSRRVSSWAVLRKNGAMWLGCVGLAMEAIECVP